MPTRKSQAPAAAMPNKPCFKLTSVQQLDNEVNKARREVADLTTARERLEQELSVARAEYAQLGEHVRELNDATTQTARRIFVRLGELDGLLQLQTRVHRRAAAQTQRRQAQGPPASPASAIPHGSPQAETPADTRAQSRAPLAVEVSLQSETNFYTGFSENISEGGLFIATYHTRQAGEQFPVEFRLPGRPQPIQTMVEVAWVREYDDTEDHSRGVPGMGVRFLSLTPEARVAIGGFLHQREALFFPEVDELI